MNSEFIKPQNLGSLLMKSSQSNFNLRLPGSYLVHSYLITTVRKLEQILVKMQVDKNKNGTSEMILTQCVAASNSQCCL